MAIVEGKLDIVISRDVLLATLDRIDGPKVELTEEELADKICRAFCGPRKLAPTRGSQVELHRRQHLEIARAIIEA